MSRLAYGMALGFFLGVQYGNRKVCLRKICMKALKKVGL